MRDRSVLLEAALIGLLAKTARPLGDGSKITPIQQLLVDKLPADADHFDAGSKEIGRVIQAYAAYRCQPDVRESAFESFDEIRSAHAGREDLDHIRARLPASQDLRWCVCTWHHWDGIAFADFDRVQVQGRADHKLCSRQDSCSGSFGVEDRAYTEEDLAAELGDSLMDDIARIMATTPVSRIRERALS